MNTKYDYTVSMSTKYDYTTSRPLNMITLYP